MSRFTTIDLPDGHLRQWDADPAEGDPGIMYVLDVLGVSIIVRERDDDVYVHVNTTDGCSKRPGEKPVTYEVNDGGGNTLGEDLSAGPADAGALEHHG